MAKLRGLHLPESFPLVVSRQAPQTPLGLHTHDFTELVVITGGRGIHFSGKEEYEITTGDAFVVSGAHGYKDTEKLNLINVLFHAGRLVLPLSEARKLPGYHAFFALEPRYRRQHKFRSCLRLPVDVLARVSDLIGRMETELSEKKPGCQFMATAYLMELIGILSRMYARVDSPESRPLLRLGKVLSHVESCFAEPMRLDDLARIAHLSESSLLRAFRAATGHAPVDYLIRVRIQRAGELLRAGQTNVKEAAFRVGFSDSNYFARQFRNITGQSPSECFPRGGGF